MRCALSIGINPQYENPFLTGYNAQIAGAGDPVDFGPLLVFQELESHQVSLELRRGSKIGIIQKGDLPVHARFLHAYPLALISIHFRTICKGLELCLACGFIFPKIVTFLRIFAYHQLFAFMENMFYLIVHDAVSVIGLRNSGKANK